MAIQATDEQDTLEQEPATNDWSLEPVEEDYGLAEAEPVSQQVTAQPEATAEPDQGWTLEPVEEDYGFGVTQQEAIPVTGEEGFLRQAADVPLKIGESINTSLRALTDLFGADNAVSQNLTQNAEWYRSLLSAQALEDEQEIGRILQEAENEGVLDQLGAGLEAFSVAPVDFVASGIGSLATFAATGLAGRAAALAGAARAGLTGARAAQFVQRGVQATQLATGAGMGAGIVKGEIYQSVKDEMLAQGKTEEEAKQIAMEAQSYMGKNLDQILIGAGLGTIDAFTGAEKIIGKVLTKGGLKPDASRIGNIIKNGITEAAPEFIQAAQEKFASNLALQREGVDVSLTQGVFSQGALEGLVGLGLGVGAGAIEPRIQTPPNKEEVSAAAAETQDVARRSMDVAPATASLVEGEAEQIVQSQAETPDERVARLQREAQEAAGEIELEEEPPVSGLPPVEPTPPVTPTPEAAVAPVEPVVPVEEARPPVTPEVVPKAENAVVEAEQKSEQESDTVKVFRGVAEAGALPTGGAFFTDSERDASAYAQLAALRKATEENEDFNDIVSEVMAEEGANDITDLSINTIKSIIEGNNIQVGDISEGAVLRGNIRLGNVLNLESFGSEVGSLPETWNELNELGLVPETWESLDEDVQEELSDKYRGKAFYSLLEGEVNLNDQFAKGIDTIVFTDQNTEGKGTHRTYLTKAAEQFAQEAAPAAVEPTPVAQPPVTPQLEPLRRVARAEQTEEDVAGLVDAGFVEVYNGQPVITQAGLEALPEAERPRLTPEARKIQIDTRTSEAAAEAISKNLRIGVDQVPPDVRMPAGWTLVGDVYVPPQPQEVGQEFTVYRGELPALEGGRQLAGIRDVGELMGIPDSATFAPFTYYSTSEQDARAYLERDAQILRDYQQRFGNEEGLKMFQSLHGFDPRTEGQMVSKKIRPRKVFDMTEMGTVADQFKMTELIAKERGVTLPENWTWRDVPAEVQKEISDYGLDIVGDPDKKDPTWQYFRNTTERTRAALIARGLSQRTKEDVRGSLFAQWLRKNGYDAVAMMHDTAQGPVKHILVINEEAAKAQEGLAPEAAPEPRRVARIEPSDIETAVVPEKAGDVFANLVRRKQKVQPAVLQKPVGSQFQSPEEFRAAFDLRGQGHTRFAIRLDLMQEDGAITEDGKNLILATIWDNNTNDEFLSNMEMGSARKNVKSYGYGGRSRQTVEGGRVEQKPLLELIRATRRGGTEADKRTALTLNTFWHEFGHAGYYSLLDAKQKKAINDAYSKTTRAGRRAFFAEGKSDIENAPYFSKYYAKNESEWFAQSFAEYVITQKSDQKKLVPVFEQLLDKIKAVFTKLFNRKEQVNLNDIFDFVLRGEAYGQRPTWQGYTMSTKPAVYGTPRGQAISPEFTKRLLAREGVSPQDERRQQIIDGISLRFKRSKNEYGNNEFKTEYDFGGRSQTIDKISFSLEQFDDSTVAVDYFPIKDGKYASVRLLELEGSFKGRAAAERAIKKAIAEIEMDERVGGATEPEPEAIPTFTEGTPEAATLKEMAASMAKVDAASEAKGGKPETYKISEIASVWMDSGLDERALQDAIVEYTNLTPANAARVAKAINKQYGLQQQIAETGAVIAEPAPEVEGAPRKTSVQRLIEQAVGVRRPIVKLEVPEKTALKDQIRLKARESRETRKARKEAAADLVQTITDYVKETGIRGPINSRQSMSLAKKALKLDVNNDKAVDRFIIYAEKVIENANYDRDVRDAKGLIKRAKTIAKAKTTAAPQATVLNAIANINPSMIDNPFEFNVLVERYLLGFLPVTSKRYSVLPDADVTAQLEVYESQVNARLDELNRAEVERFLAAQADFAERRGMTVDEAMALLNSNDDITPEVEGMEIEKQQVINGLLNNLAQASQKTLMGYDDSANDAYQKKIISFMKRVNVENITADEKKRYIRFANNIIANGQTFGAEQFEAIALGQERAIKASKDKRLADKFGAWIGKFTQDIAGENLKKVASVTQSQVDTLKNIFGRENLGVISTVLGLSDLDIAQTEASNVKEELANDVSDFYDGQKKKYGSSATSIETKGYAGLAAYLIQVKGNETQENSIAYRRRLVEENIQELRKSERQKDQNEASLKDRILGELTGTTNAEILTNLKEINPSAYEQLVWWKDVVFPKYKDFLKAHIENFRNQANSYDNPDYLAIAYLFGDTFDLNSELETSQYDDSISLRVKQAANSIKRKDHPTLPKSKSGNIANIDINFGVNQYNALVDQIERAYTAPKWEAIYAFTRTTEFEGIMGGRRNAEFVKKMLGDIKSARSRHGTNDIENRIMSGFVAMARRMSSQAVMGGFSQAIVQPGDQFLKLISTTGRYDLIGKNMLEFKNGEKLMSKFPISRRGDVQAGTQFASTFAELGRRVEASVTGRKWAQFRETMKRVGELWMGPLRISDVYMARVAWMTYYESYLNKRKIYVDDWAKEADLVETDDIRKEAAAQAESLVDLYMGASDPTKMASLSRQSNNGWREFAKLKFLPLNSFALQQKSVLISDIRDLALRTGDKKAALAAIMGNLAGMASFHYLRIFIVGGMVYPLAQAMLKGIFGVDMDEPDEEKQKEELETKWRKFYARMMGNIFAGGAGQLIENVAVIDAFNYASYLFQGSVNPDSLLDDKGEVMSFGQYEKKMSPLYRYRAFDKSEYSFGLADVITEQAQRTTTETAKLLNEEDMSQYTGDEQAYAYFATVMEWLYFFRLMDTDVTRIVRDLKRQMDKGIEERETELKRIREGR